MDFAQFYSGAGGVLIGVLAAFLLEKLYQRRAQLKAAKFEVLKIIRDHMDTLERMILEQNEKKKGLRHARARRIVRASRMLNLNAVVQEAEYLVNLVKGDNQNRGDIIKQFDILDKVVNDEYKKHLPIIRRSSS